MEIRHFYSCKSSNILNILQVILTPIVKDSFPTAFYWIFNKSLSTLQYNKTYFHTFLRIHFPNRMIKY